MAYLLFPTFGKPKENQMISHKKNTREISLFKWCHNRSGLIMNQESS